MTPPQRQQTINIGADPKLYGIFALCVVVVFMVVFWLSSFSRADRAVLMNDTLERSAEIMRESMHRVDSEYLLIAQLSASNIAADPPIRDTLRSYQQLLSVQSSEVAQQAARDALGPLLSSHWQRLQPYRITQLYVHAAPQGKVLHRAHHPEYFGDTFVPERPLVADALASGEVLSAVDAGRFGIGYRAVAPITDPDGQVLGAIEVGLELLPEILLNDRAGSVISVLIPQRPGTEIDPEVWQTQGSRQWLIPVGTDARFKRWLGTDTVSPSDLRTSFIRLRDDGKDHMLVPFPVRGYGQSDTDVPLAIMLGLQDVSALVSWRQTREMESLRNWFGGGMVVLLALLFLMRYVDNNARLQTESNLRKVHVLERKLMALYRSSPVAITLSRLDDGRLLETNPALSKLTGFSEEELKQMDYRQLIPEELLEKETEARRSMRTHGRYGPISHQFIGSDGELIDVRLSGVLFEDEQGDLFIWSIIQDMRDVAAVTRMKDDFISTVSHELRTPLTSIAGSLGLVLSGATGELSGKTERMLSIALKNSQRLTALINDLLDIEKLAAGKMTFNNVPTPLVSLLEDALEQNRSFAQQHKVNLLLNAESKVLVNADSGRLHQVLANLISNACKFSPPNSDVIIGCRASQGWVRVTVDDSGSGIDKASQEKLFQRFSQVHKQGAGKGGTGLGLAISREIIERLGGKIGVQSEPGQGSSFWFELPVEPDNRKGLVLLVNDLGEMARPVRRQLEQQGYDTDWVTTGEDALDATERRSYDMVLLETRVIHRGGLTWLNTLRDNSVTAHLPVMAISTYVGNDEVRFGTAFTVVNGFTKSAKTDQLISSLVPLLAEHKSGAALCVDDDEAMNRALFQASEKHCRLFTASSLEEARRMIKAHDINLLLLNYSLVGGQLEQLTNDLAEAGEMPLSVALIFEDSMAFPRDQVVTRRARPAITLPQVAGWLSRFINNKAPGVAPNVEPGRART